MKISLIYNKHTARISTVKDHVLSFQKYSKHDVNYIDANDFINICNIDSEIVVLHYSIMHHIASGLSNFIYTKKQIQQIHQNIKNTQQIIKYTQQNIIKTQQIKIIKNTQQIIKYKQQIVKYKQQIEKGKLYELFKIKEIKNTLFYNLTKSLLNYQGIKIAFIQDEYYDTNLIKMFLEIINVNTVFSCVPNEHISRIYNNLNNRFVFNLTGYVPEYNFDRIPIKDRMCHVFYRGRELHYLYGDLGQDKMNIGKRMKEYCDKYKLISNINWDGNNCIYGDEWFKVLGSSKVTLATESGTTIFDMDNLIVTEINNHLEETPNRGHQNGYSKVPKYSYEQICKLVNLKRNEVPNMGQISPKMFESIMLGTVLVMYEGYYYPGFLIPNVHYIVLKKDYSNIKEVINKIKDDDFLQKMSNKAYEDIIKSGLYSYKKFIEMFDKEVDRSSCKEHVNNNNNNNKLEWYPYTAKDLNKEIIIKNIYLIDDFMCKNNLEAKQNILMLRAESFGLDPRRDLWYNSIIIKKNIKIFHQCIYSNGCRLVNNKIPNFVNNIIDNNNYDFKDFEKLSLNKNNITFLNNLKKIMSKKIKNTCKSFDSYKKYILSTAFKHIVNYKNKYKIILAINFTTLIPAIFLKNIYNIKIVYECLEWWPYNNYRNTNEEIEYWIDFEKELVKYTDICNTVSPGLANKMSNKYNKIFSYLPNCIPLSISKKITIKTTINDKCRFLFQGCLCPKRNLEFLIHLWDKVNENAILIIRGPYYIYVDKLKLLAKNNNLLNKRIFFPEEISSDKLLEGINNDCDIGLIPYGPLTLNYKYCSPNKMGEFMSMGKPILANKTEYVSQVISEANCGIVVDFANENLLIDSINKLTKDIQLRKVYSENAFKYHEKEFNWENQSHDFYNKIYELHNIS